MPTCLHDQGVCAPNEVHLLLVLGPCQRVSMGTTSIIRVMGWNQPTKPPITQKNHIQELGACKVVVNYHGTLMNCRLWTGQVVHVWVALRDG